MNVPRLLQRLNYFLNAVGLSKVSTRTFHRHKNDYLLPAVEHVFTKCQEGVFERLRDRLSKVFYSSKNDKYTDVTILGGDAASCGGWQLRLAGIQRRMVPLFPK